MKWGDLPADIRSLILKEIASLSEIDLHRLGVPGGVFLLEDDEYELVQQSHQHEDDGACDAYRDIQSCLRVCRDWRKLVNELLVVYGPTEVVIRKGSEQLATAAVRCWLTKRKRSGNAPIGWHIGRQDLLALSIQRGFVDCMVLLLDHFSRKGLLSYWEEHQWAAACYPHMAAATGRTVILQMLQRYGLDIDQMDWRERTPLAVAVRQNQAQVADYLLSVGVGRDLTLLLPAEIIDAENYGEHYRLSMIEWAASRGTLEMMEVLIKHGLFPYRSSQRHGPEPLHWVLQRHDLPYVEDLARLTLEHTSLENIQLRGARLLASAIEHHASTDLIRRLITIGISINEPSWVTPLDLAAQMAEEETIHLLIENGARCTLDAVNAALERDRGDLVDILLPCCGKSTLREHALDGNVEMVKTYLTYGAEVNPIANGKSLLSEVAYRGYLDICKLLVEAGADLTEEDGVGDTPLSNAIFAHRIDVVQFLLECGAPVKSTHYDPLLAVIAAHDLMSSGWNKSVIGLDATKTLIRLLIDHGADVNAVSDAYGTPLHKAIRLGVLEIAKCLLDNGADVDIPVEGYGTPLQLAALLGLQGIMRLLLQHGAKVNGTTGNHGRPLQAAITSGSLVCVKLLLDNGASLESGDGYPNALEKARRCWEDNQNWKRREIIEFIHDCFEERGFFDMPDPS